MNGLSRLGPALEVALFVLSIVTVALPAQSSSHFAARHRPHLHPVLCRLLVICVATCFGVSGLVRLVSYDNLDIFASRLIELVGQSAATFTTVWLFLKSLDRVLAPSAPAHSFLPSHDNTNFTQSKLRSTRRVTSHLPPVSSRVFHGILVTLFVIATLLSFVCILPLAVYPLDNGAPSKTWVPLYVGPLFESLLALLLLFCILFLNINSTGFITPIIPSPHDRPRAPACVCNLCVAATGRGLAMLLLVQFLSLVTYAFTIGASAVNWGSDGRSTSATDTPPVRAVELHFIGDVLLVLWIASWVGLFSFLATRPGLLFIEPVVGASQINGTPIMSTRERAPASRTDSRPPSSIYFPSKTQKVKASSEDSPLGTTTIIPRFPTSPPPFGGSKGSPHSSTISAFGVPRSGSGSRGKGNDSEELVMVELDDGDDDRCLDISPSFVRPPPTNTAFSSLSSPSPPPGLATSSPPSHPLHTEPHTSPARDTSVTSSCDEETSVHIPSPQQSIWLSSLSPHPTGIPIVAAVKRDEQDTYRLQQAPATSEGLSPIASRLCQKGHQNQGTGVDVPAPAHRAPSVRFAGGVGPETLPSGRVWSRYEHESPPKLASESERERVKSTLGPSSGRTSRIGFRTSGSPSTSASASASNASGGYGWTRWKEKIVGAHVRRTEMHVYQEEESPRRLITSVPLRPSDALNMLESVVREGSPALVHTQYQGSIPTPLHRPQVQRRLPSPRLPIPQSQNEYDHDPENYISTEAALNSILEHYGHDIESENEGIASTHYPNLGPTAPVVLESPGGYSQRRQPPSTPDYQQRTFIPLSPSEEFLADFQGDPFASVPSTPRPTTSVAGTIRSGGGNESIYAASHMYSPPSTPSSPAFPPTFAPHLPFPPVISVSPFRRVSDSGVSGYSGDSASAARVYSATASSTNVSKMTASSTAVNEAERLSIANTFGVTSRPSSSRSARSRPKFLSGVQRPKGGGGRPKKVTRRPSTAPSASGSLEHSQEASTSSPPLPSVPTISITASQDRNRSRPKTTESAGAKLEKGHSKSPMTMTTTTRGRPSTSTGASVRRRTLSDPHDFECSTTTQSERQIQRRSRSGSSPSSGGSGEKEKEKTLQVSDITLSLLTTANAQPRVQPNAVPTVKT